MLFLIRTKHIKVRVPVAAEAMRGARRRQCAQSVACTDMRRSNLSRNLQSVDHVVSIFTCVLNHSFSTLYQHPAEISDCAGIA